MIDLTEMATEARNPESNNLSALSISEAVDLFNKEDLKVIETVTRAKGEIVKAIEKSSETLINGGRIIYIGAGTSGRLGLIDAVECPPTFGVDYNTVVGIIAGGDSAFIKAKENSEDNPQEVIDDLKKHNLSDKDMVIGIAASGRTPYVISGLKYAQELGCKTAAIVCNYNSLIKDVCNNTIEIVTGPEILTGSTRLKAGTATKLVLNMISTISMVKLGKVYKNYMVDVKLSNEKLVQRAHNMVMEVCDCSFEVANKALNKSHNSAKTAIVMILLDTDYENAKTLLDTNKGSIEALLRKGE